MKGDFVCIDGKLTRSMDDGIDPNTILASNFIYQKIHTLGHNPLQAEWLVEIAEMSYNALYGCPAALSVELIEKEVKALLDANRYPPASNLVTLYLFSSDGNPPTRLLSCEKQLLYKGYTMWHTGYNCAVMPYEYPFSPHKTAVSLAAHTYATDYARRKGFDAAITENNTGVLTGVGEDPLFAVIRDTVITTSINDGAAESVERRLGITVCKDMGLTVTEQPLRVEDIGNYDELFTVTPQGIVSVRTCADKLFSHSMAKNIAVRLKNITP